MPILERAITVGELNEYVALLFKGDELLRGLQVVGEISGFKRHSSGHMYFSLKDENALVRCVMFKQSAYNLTFRPQDGMRVVLTGYASLYERDGQFQLYARSMEKAGEGELHKKFLLLKTRLEAEGYFDVSRKRNLPFLPKCVGVVTSGTGAAVQDIQKIMLDRFPNMHILICPVAVQGEKAAQEIANGIKRMNADGRADVLIVGRGGGSFEDLFAFSERVVADAIFESSIPIVSAVGHETDFSISDFVADKRAATPSEAATMVVPMHDALMHMLDEMNNRLSRAIKTGVDAKRERVRMLQNSAALHAVTHTLSSRRQLLNERQASLKRALEKRKYEAETKLKLLTGRLETLSPRAVLERGFALIEDGEGRAIGGVKNLKTGDSVRLTWMDGCASAHIDAVEETVYGEKS